MFSQELQDSGVQEFRQMFLTRTDYRLHSFTPVTS